MNALLVGADRLGNIPEVLAEFGIRIADTSPAASRGIRSGRRSPQEPSW